MHPRVAQSGRTRLASLIALVALLAGSILPYPAARADEVAPAATCPTSISIVGPADGSLDSYYSFTATMLPANSGTNPAIRWEVTDHTTFTTSGVSSTQEFQWTTGGYKTIKVTAHAGAIGECTRVITDEIQIAISPLPLTDVPADVYRLAAQLLEEQRQVTPNWADASFYGLSGAEAAGAVTPLYRPDVDGPAYFEFQVFGPTDPNTYRGFIIVSTGAHDHPIPNWSSGWDYEALGDPDADYVGWSPTRRMRQESGWTADKFYKLDTLSYVAEDINATPSGAAVAFRGTLPPKVNWPDGWIDNPPPLVTTSWVPTTLDGLDDLADGNTTVESTEVITPTVEVPDDMLGAWDSWGDLKTGFTSNYAPLIEALAESAAPEWEAIALQSEYGYVLHKGESITFPMLWDDPSPAPSGPAWDEGLVTVDYQSPAGTAPRLVVTAVNDLFLQGVPMSTTITYGGGEVEVLNVLVVNDNPYYCYLPVTLNGTVSGSSTGTSSSSGTTTLGAFSLASASTDDIDAQAYTPGTLATDGYTYWFVGGTQAEADAQQPWYKQFDSTGCKSGCGPTAWAMLIAWADRQAASGTNDFWAGRTGLYREDGGRGDPSIVAPRWWDDVTQGEGVKSMIEEIRLFVGTWCNAFSDSGATWPHTMFLVVNYLTGRTGVNVNTWYLPAGFSLTGADGDTVRSAARNVIQNAGDARRPTVIGTGFLSHYPLAYGYRSKTQQSCSTSYKLVNGKMTWVTSCTSYLLKGFLVNQGWGDGAGEWVSADIWFNGRLTPHISGANDIGFYRSSDDTFRFDTDHDLADMFYFRYEAGTMPYSVRPVVGDFDRDGLVDDLGHYVYSYWDSAKRYDWYLDYEANASVERILDAWTTGTYGNDGWPLALDYDRDGFVDDLAVYYPEYLTGAGICYRTDMDGQKMCTGYGGLNEYLVPVTGDFDRDGFHDDIAFYSQSRRAWQFDMDHDGDFDNALAWPPSSQVGDQALPIAGDFDQDRVADDIGLFDPAYQKWWFDYNHDGSTNDSGAGWGMAGDLPYAGNFWQN